MKKKITMILLLCFLCVNMVGCGAVTKVGAAEFPDKIEEEVSEEESICDILLRVAVTTIVDNAMGNLEQKIIEMKGDAK